MPADAVASILLRHVVRVHRLDRRASEDGPLRAGNAVAVDRSHLAVGIGASVVPGNEAPISKSDARTCNSVIHFVDSIL